MPVTGRREIMRQWPPQRLVIPQSWTTHGCGWNLLGPFSMRLGERSAGPWDRPPAKRLCELIMLSPGLRVAREVVRELLFANLRPAASASPLPKALSLAREGLSVLGDDVADLLRADRAHIWASPDVPLDVDLVAHEQGLRSALAMGPGRSRDTALSAALAEDGVLLEDEPYSTGRCDPERPSTCCAEGPG